MSSPAIANTHVSVAQLRYSPYVNEHKSRIEFAVVQTCKVKNNYNLKCIAANRMLMAAASLRLLDRPG